MKRLRLPLLALACATAIYGGARMGGLVINTTPSLPLGIYRKLDRPVRTGALVLFELPACEAGERVPGRAPLLKRIVAVDGDEVSVGVAGASINGVALANSAQLAWDHDGKPLPRPVLDHYILQPGELLAMSTYNPRSFDSRYFGPIRREWIVAVVEPVCTW